MKVRSLAGGRLWAIWLVVSIVASLASFGVGLLVRSQWEQAETNARQDLVVVAAVEHGAITPELVAVSGNLGLGTSLPVGVGSAVADSVVTRHRVSVGDSIPSGTAVLDVSGRSIIVVALPFRLYRDLHVGDSGDDVSAWQTALKDLGIYSGSVQGRFDSATAKASETLFKRQGIPAPPIPVEATEALRAAQGDLAKAKQEGAPPSELGPLRDAVAAAQAQTSPWVAAREIIPIPAAEVLVKTMSPIGTELGQENSPPAAVLVAGAPMVSVRIGMATIDAFELDTVVDIAQQTSNLRAQGIVVSRSDFKKGDDAGNNPGYDVTIAPHESEWSGAEGPVLVTPSAAREEEGMIVPLAAVRTDAKGTYVQVVTSSVKSGASAVVEPDVKRVAVATGVSSGGRVLVEADLEPGQFVMGLPPFGGHLVSVIVVALEGCFYVWSKKEVFSGVSSTGGDAGY